VFSHGRTAAGQLVVGGVTSGAYGHTVGTACGLAVVRTEVPSGTEFVVDCAGTLVPAEVSDTAFWATSGGG
jgi:glycine cleavage system aminomethyltransferase T